MSVRFSGAVKRFAGQAAVDGVSFDLAPGEFFTVLGPSGCGKSTLIRLIAGLETLDEGEIALEGATVSAPGLHVPPEDRRVGVVFQSYALWPHMDVRGNVAFAMECRGMSRAEARRAAEAPLEAVDLAAFAAREPAALSGGQRQRVALARCLASGAKIVLMDEPLANLDPHLRGRMEEELTRFHRASGATTVYITHDQREAMAMADRIAVMERGRILQLGSPEQVHDRPNSEAVARFIGQAAILPGRAVEGGVDLGPMTAPLLAEAPGPGLRVVVRPGAVRIDPEGPAPARIETAFYRGGAWEGRAAVEGLAEPLPVRSETRLRPGDALRLALGPLWPLPL